MNEIDRHATGHVFREVLEQQAFMFGRVIDEGEEAVLPDGMNDCVEVAIDFDGPRAGSLTLMTSRSLATLLAANVLGVDHDDPQAEKGAHDALGELVNVTMGHLLTRSLSRDAVFDLSPPRLTSDVPPAVWRDFAHHADTVAVLVEGHWVFLRSARHANERESGGLVNP